MRPRLHALADGRVASKASGRRTPYLRPEREHRGFESHPPPGAEPARGLAALQPPL